MRSRSFTLQIHHYNTRQEIHTYTNTHAHKDPHTAHIHYKHINTYISKKTFSNAQLIKGPGDGLLYSYPFVHDTSKPRRQPDLLDNTALNMLIWFTLHYKLPSRPCSQQRLGWHPLAPILIMWSSMTSTGTPRSVMLNIQDTLRHPPL